MTGHFQNREMHDGGLQSAHFMRVLAHAIFRGAAWLSGTIWDVCCSMLPELRPQSWLRQPLHRRRELYEHLLVEVLGAELDRRSVALEDDRERNAVSPLGTVDREGDAVAFHLILRDARRAVRDPSGSRASAGRSVIIRWWVASERW